MEKDNIKGCFVSSVLLSQNQWDKKQFIHDFEEDWGIVLTDDDDNGDVLVGMFSGMTLAIAIMPGPVPNGEAEHYAQGNYLWKDATEVARQHEAHILVSVTGDQSNLLERAKLFTRATSSCLKQSYATAVYTDGMVFQPEYHMKYITIREPLNLYRLYAKGLLKLRHRISLVEEKVLIALLTINTIANFRILSR